MKIRLEVDGHTFNVSLRRNGPSMTATCEGDTLTAQPQVRDGSVHFGAIGHSSNVEFPRPGIVLVDAKGHSFHILAFEPGGDDEGTQTNGLRPVLAVMPGRLLKILVRPGDTVRKGHPLFVLEAMKMQNELTSPGDGTIAELDCHEGDVVESGKVLARLGPLSA